MNTPMTPAPTPAEVAAEIERLSKRHDVDDASFGYAVRHHLRGILPALRALGEPDEAAVERAAEAACELHGVPGRWGRLHEPDRRYWRDIARAALRSRAADE